MFFSVWTLTKNSEVASKGVWIDSGRPSNEVWGWLVVRTQFRTGEGDIENGQSEPVVGIV